MGDVIELWPHQAVNKAMEALEEFKETGSRESFKKWKEKYGDKIEHEKKVIISILTGEKPMNSFTPIDDMKKDASIMEHEKWYEKHGGELWIMYHEEGANYDTNYEEWCENRYNKYAKGGNQ